MKTILYIVVGIALLVGGFFVLNNYIYNEKQGNGAEVPTNGGNGQNTSEEIETRIDQGASALDVKVTPHEVLEDSRCPVDVECIQAGTVRVRATLESGLGTAPQVFTLGQPITTEVEEVTLVRVHPLPHSEVEIEPSDYVFYFEIKKRQ